jgi:hypothetical protein
VRHHALGGGQAGYNWQLGVWVARIEADVQFSPRRLRLRACNAVLTSFDAPVAPDPPREVRPLGIRPAAGRSNSPDYWL